MRTVATALVLIAGAAVILWYGSTLNNSWVLGGLIGGLAAILLSIPISLTLFSHLSRRHDERMERTDHIDEQEEGRMRLAREYEYPAVPARRAYEVEGRGYTIHEEYEDAYDDEDEYWHQEEMEQQSLPRRLPAPSAEEQRLRQRQHMTRPMQQTMNGAIDMPAHRSQVYLSAPRQQAQQPSQLQQPQQGTAQRKDTKVLHSTSLHTMSQHRMEAMRRARREAAREAQDNVEVSPTNYSRREQASRGQQRQGNQSQYVQGTQRNRSSEVLRPASNPPRNRTAGESDTTSKMQKRQFYRSSDEENEDATFQAPIRQREPETDYIDNQLSPRITPSRRAPQTEQIIRRARTKDLQLDSSQTSEEDMPVNRPLLRRAPYMYEDDELRQRLSQQIDPPTVRRSSRQEAWQEEE